MDRRFSQPRRTRAGPDDEPARRVPPLTDSSQPDWAGAIIGLHDFFTRWFAGEIPDTDESFAAVADALAPGFTIVMPSGLENDRSGTLDAIRRAHGRGGLRISIDGVRPLHTTGSHALVRYVEVQDRDDGPRTERVSTALLEADPIAPDGVRWHAVHETWLPDGGPT